MKISLLILLTLITSCSSIENVNKPTDYKEIICLQNVKGQEVWDWINKYMNSHEFIILEKDEQKKYIAGHREMTGWSWGEFLGFQIQEKKDETKISFKSAKRQIGNWTAINWESRIRTEINKKYKKHMAACN